MSMVLVNALTLMALLLPRAMMAGAPPSSPLARSLESVHFPDTTRLDPAVQQQLAESQAALRSLLEKPATPERELSEAYGSLGKLYHAYQLMEAAGGCYRNAQMLAPQDFRWIYYLGRLYQSEGRLADSAASFQKALAIRPNDEAAQTGLAEVYMAQDRLDDAEPLYAQVLAEDPTSAAAMAGLGKCESSRHNFRKAVEYFEAALMAQPDAGVHYPLAMAYRGLGDRQRALDHLSKGEGRWPSGPDPLMDELGTMTTGKGYFFLRGDQALRQGDLARAVEEYQKMVAADPSDPAAQAELGGVLARHEDFQAAKEHFYYALRLAPGNATALYNLGILCTQTGSGHEAIRYYEAALRSDPGLKEAHFQLANELMRTERFEEAIPHYQTVVKLGPRNGFARLMLAVVLARLRRYQEAQTILEESHIALPDDRDISAALARLLAASPESTLRNGQRALQLIEPIFKSQQTVDIEQVEVLAMAFAEIGSFEKAIEIQQLMISEADLEGRPELVQSLGETLTLYRQRKACRRPWGDDDPILKPVPGSLGPLNENRNPAGMVQETQR